MRKPREINNLYPEMNLIICLKQLFSKRVKEMFSYETATARGKDIDSIHNMQVALRSLQTTTGNRSHSRK